MNVNEIMNALVEPFEPSEVKSKPVVISGNSAMALFYVDARVIQDRLDKVLGVEGWQDDYECLPCGSVVCRLRVKLGEEWLTKVDVGSPSEQPNDGDKLKAAFSDALKRAAVKFGVGRYLYRVPSQWCDYDPQKKRFVTPPQLPGFARPSGKAAQPVAKPEQPKAGETITTEEGRELWDALKQNGADIKKLFAHYHITRLGELPAEHFADARGRIERRAFSPEQAALPLEVGQ